MLYWSTVRAFVIFFKVSASPTALASAATPSTLSVVSGGGNSIRIICCVHNVLLSRDAAVFVRSNVRLHIIMRLVAAKRLCVYRRLIGAP